MSGFRTVGMECASDSTDRGFSINLPVTAVVRNSAAIAFGEIAPKEAAANGDSGTNDHKEDASRDFAHDVRE